MGILNNIKTKFIKQREENIEESTKKIEKIEKIEKCKIILAIKIFMLYSAWIEKIHL